MTQQITDRDTWLAARLELLQEEKALQGARDELARKRRALPRVLVERDYVFEGESGPAKFPDLFFGCSQLIVYHFMFHPDWSEGCKSCSFWADNYDRSRVHLRARDVSLVATSSAPLEKLLAYRSRLGWSFPWFSSGKSKFNSDFNVTFTPDEITSGDVVYNYRKNNFGGPEAPGISVFERDKDDAIFHTYSTYSRGLDPYNATYQLLDIAPKGRNEDDLPYSMDWVRRNDEY